MEAPASSPMDTPSGAIEAAEISAAPSIPANLPASPMEVAGPDTTALSAATPDELKAARKAERKAKKAAAKLKSTLIVDYDQRAYSPSVFDPLLHFAGE